MLKSICEQIGVRVHVFKGGRIAQQVASGPRYDWAHLESQSVSKSQGNYSTFHARTPMDIVVGSLGGLKKLFDEGYLRKSRVVEVGIDEVDSMLDDTFRCKSQHFAYSINPADLVLENYPFSQPRDETLAFLRQFGSSGQAVISGVSKLLTLYASAFET